MDMDPSNGVQHQEMNAQSAMMLNICSKKARAEAEQSLKCPRCDSINTKFCYYNNYSLSQPRYFCKSCRRYWTKGGTLRNVPVGGGCRKNHKLKSSSLKRSSSSSTTSESDYPIITQLPALTYDHHESINNNDLALAFARLQNKHANDFHLNYPASINYNYADNNFLGNPNSTSGFLDSIRSGFVDHVAQNVHFNQNLHCYGFDHHDNSTTMTGDFIQQLHYGEDQQVVNNNIAMKQEVCINGSDQNENGKVLWELFSNINNNGGGDGNYSNLDSGIIRESWNSTTKGLNSSSNWHGLINTPLM